MDEQCRQTMASSQARTALVVTNAAREYNCDSLGVIMNQNEPGTHTQGLNSGTELILMEMPEVQYANLQNVILEFPDCIIDTSPGPDLSAAQTLTTPWYVDQSTLMTSPSLSTEAIDLTVDRSPSMCGDGLWSVLDKIRADVESPADASSILTRPCSAVRACLEKRFNSMPAAAAMPTQQDAQSAALTKFRSMIEQSSGSQDAFINPLMQKWIRSDLDNPMELSVPYGGSMLNTSMQRQVLNKVLGNRNLPHMVEPNKHQGPAVTEAQCNIRTIPAGEQQQQQMKTECVAVAKPVTFVKSAKKRSPLSSMDRNAVPTQQDAQSAALTKFQSMIEQSSEGQDAFINPQMQKWIRSDLENPMESSVLYGGSMLNTSMQRQVLGNRNLPHMVEPNTNQGHAVTKAQCNIRTIPAVEQQQQMKTECKSVAVGKPATFVKIAKKRSPLNSKDGNATQDSKNWMAGLLSTKKVCISPTEQILGARERHNMKERVRRKKISQCCEELNSLVPFCDKTTDKANTLLWTTAFLRHINETHAGDSIKQDFQNKVLLRQTKSFSTMRS